MAKLLVARALTAFVAHRVMKLATVFAVAVFVTVLLLTCALVYFFSPWWWLLMIPFVVVLGVFLLIRVFAGFVIGRVHSESMTKQQRTALSDFVDKIQALIEARATPLPLFALICIKDIILYRDVTTVKKLIFDTTSLRRDYDALEKIF